MNGIKYTVRSMIFAIVVFGVTAFIDLQGPDQEIIENKLRMEFGHTSSQGTVQPSGLAVLLYEYVINARY